MRKGILVLFSALLSVTGSWAASARPSPLAKKKPAAQVSVKALDPSAGKKKFVLDVVRMAVALPQPDPQDRLRVLNSAAGVAAPLAPQLARSFAREGARLEADLIASGQTPAVSLLSSGQVDCATAVSFIESIPAAAVQRAEQSILGAMTLCSKQTLEPTRQKLETALNSGVLAARALLAVMEISGARSPWSQTYFGKLFSSLPAPDSAEAAQEAPNFAAMFNRMAPEVEKDAARDAGLKMLEWLGKVKPGNRVTISSGE